MNLHFYEIHEGATDMLTDPLLVSERAYSPEEFEQLVRAARDAVIDTFEEDTLVEAVARELERSANFTYIGDEKLAASMAVSARDEDTYLIEHSGEYRSLIAELDVG
jgi:hypothetical protein